MVESNRGETFETYPYRESGPEPEPELTTLAFGPTAPPAPPPLVQSAPLHRGRAGGPDVSRRSLVIGGLVVGAAGLLGFLGLAGSRTPDTSYAEATEAPPLDENYEEEIEDEVGYVTLETGYAELGVTVPAGWRGPQDEEVVDYLRLSHDSGWLAARAPERRSADTAGLAREADYLREGFEPVDKPPTFSDESDTRFTVLTLTRAGHFGGEPAAESALLIVDREQDHALVVWWATVLAHPEVAAQARSMTRELRRGFEDA